LYISSVARSSLTSDKASQVDIETAVQTAIRAPQQIQLLRLLYGTRNLFRWNKAIPWNPDQVADLSSLLYTCDAYRAQNLLYPLLLSVSSSREVRLQPLPLKRDAMLISAAGDKSFIIETGNELVLYQLVPSTLSHVTDESTAQKQQASAPQKSVLTFLGAPLLSAAAAPPPESKHESHETCADNKFWLLNYLHNKLALAGTSPLRPVISQAGTYSSVYFMEHLIEDGAGSATEDGDSTARDHNQSFDTYMEIVRSRSIDLLLNGRSSSS